VTPGCSKSAIFARPQPGRLFSPATLRVHGTRCSGTRLFLARAALSKTRTNHGTGHVSACQGWAGETTDIFNILLGWAS
jgi:hypothetical protein